MRLTRFLMSALLTLPFMGCATPPVETEPAARLCDFETARDFALQAGDSIEAHRRISAWLKRQGATAPLSAAQVAALKRDIAALPEAYFRAEHWPDNLRLDVKTNESLLVECDQRG